MPLEGAELDEYVRSKKEERVSKEGADDDSESDDEDNDDAMNLDGSVTATAAAASANAANAAGAGFKRRLKLVPLYPMYTNPLLLVILDVHIEATFHLLVVSVQYRWTSLCRCRYNYVEPAVQSDIYGDFINFDDFKVPESMDFSAVSAAHSHSSSKVLHIIALLLAHVYLVVIEGRGGAFGGGGNCHGRRRRGGRGGSNEGTDKVGVGECEGKGAPH